MGIHTAMMPSEMMDPNISKVGRLENSFAIVAPVAFAEIIFVIREEVPQISRALKVSVQGVFARELFLNTSPKKP